MKKIYILIIISFWSINYLTAQTSAVSGITTSTVNEAEAHIAINPSNNNQMAVGYMEDNNGLKFKIYYSVDAGNTWNQSSFNAPGLSNPLFPGLLAIGGGDIILAYDKTGKLYASWIYLYYNQSTDSAFFTGFWASSLDNGQTFQFENVNNNDEFFGRGVMTNSLQTITNAFDGICDRQWMAVDHSNGSNANRLYIGFVNYTSNFGGLKVRSKAASATSFGNLTTMVSGNYQLSNLAVDKNGVLHYSFAQTTAPFGIWHKASTDGGSTFSALHKIGNSLDPFPPAPHYVNDRENAAPSLAIDGDNNLHVTWTDCPPGQEPKAYYAYSKDGGVTWSTPMDISAKLGLGTFFVNVSAAGNKVSLSTYGIDPSKKSDYYLLISGDNGLNFGPPIKLTNQQSDFGNFATTSFAGDYTSSVRTTCNTFSVWADLRGGGQPKLYLSRYADCGALGTQELTTINSPFQFENLYPNPANKELFISLKNKKSGKVDTRIYSIDGKLMYSKEHQLKEGKQKLMVSVASLAPGNYTLVLQDERGNKIIRMFGK